MASSLASALARGQTVAEGVRLAKRFVVEAVRNSFPIGSGHGPVSQLWPVRPWWREDPTDVRSDERGRAHLGNAT
jgi:hydroxymethylpyrimidine/phosphomethylpyrimidine kinase